MSTAVWGVEQCSHCLTAYAKFKLLLYLMIAEMSYFIMFWSSKGKALNFDKRLCQSVPLKSTHLLRPSWYTYYIELAEQRKTWFCHDDCEFWCIVRACSWICQLVDVGGGGVAVYIQGQAVFLNCILPLYFSIVFLRGCSLHTGASCMSQLYFLTVLLSSIFSLYFSTVFSYCISLLYFATVFPNRTLPLYFSAVFCHCISQLYFATVVLAVLLRGCSLHTVGHQL